MKELRCKICRELIGYVKNKDYKVALDISGQLCKNKPHRIKKECIRT